MLQSNIYFYKAPYHLKIKFKKNSEMYLKCTLYVSVIVILLVWFKVSCSAHHCCLWWAVKSVHHDDSHQGNACVNARTLQIQVSKVEVNIKKI